jgi:cation diffusion facilitator family transporter
MFSTTSGAAKLSLIVVIGLIVFKVVVSVITGSISISAQAADSSLDLFAIAIIFFAVRMASKPADEQHPFGHGKVESIAATGQAALLFTASGVIIYLAVQRIIKGTTIELTEAGIGVMLVSIIVSIFLSRHLLKVSRATDSVAIEALARNIAADVYSAAGVLAALAAIRFTGLSILDPIIAVVVAFFILKAARNVIRKSFGELVDVRLPKTEQNEIVFCVKEHTGQLVGFHEIRTRKAGNQRFIDLHLVMPRNVSVEEAHLMCDHLEQDIKNRLPNSSITIHVEPCSTECDQCTTFSCSLRKQSL